LAKRRRVRTPTAGQHEVAAGDIGDRIWWKEGYECLSRGQALIALLYELDDWQTIDWGHLLRRLPRFDFLRTLGPKEFFHNRAWNRVEGFTVVEPDEEETTGSITGEWTHIRIEMDHSMKKAIFRDFDELSSRLEAYPPLGRYL
jgi:hypothetical protein